MGYYIETGSPKGKADYLIHKFGGMETSQPDNFTDVGNDSGLVCVVNNGPFEAAAYCFSEREFEDFTLADDYRPKRWVILGKEVVEQLSGYVECGR